MYVCQIEKMTILRIQRVQGKQNRSREDGSLRAAFLDLHCLKIQVFSFFRFQVFYIICHYSEVSDNIKHRCLYITPYESRAPDKRGYLMIIEG